jgi:hypothetical protein
MDIAKVISHLRLELELLNQAIHSLEPLVPSRRGRPKKTTQPDLKEPGAPGSVPKNSRRRPPGNALAASREDVARQPGTERARKGASVD